MRTRISRNRGLLYRRHKNLLTKVTHAICEKYYCLLLETFIGNSKKIWSNINCILGKKHSSINTTIKLDGIHVAEPETIANMFNYYYYLIIITIIITIIILSLWLEVIRIQPTFAILRVIRGD